MARVVGLLLLLVCFGSGCGQSGPATYEVSGDVTWKGKPLEDGYISFIAEDGATHPGAGKIENGKFRFRVGAGAKRVEISANREKPGQTSKVMGLREKEQFLPPRYNSESKLKAEVKEDGSNHFIFDLVE